MSNDQLCSERIDNQIVRIYNDNTYPLIETYKGDKIHIVPGGFIEMDFYEANEFKSFQGTPIKLDGAGNKKPESFKKVRIVLPQNFKAIDDNESTKLKCQACGKVFLTKEELDKHIVTFHASQKFDEDRDRRLKKC